MNEVAIGRCSICGGVVTVPECYWSVIPLIPKCNKCGAVMNIAETLPEVPMIPNSRNEDSCDFSKRSGEQYFCGRSD